MFTEIIPIAFALMAAIAQPDNRAQDYDPLQQLITVPLSPPFIFSTTEAAKIIVEDESCTNESGESGTCVTYNRCKGNHTVSNDKEAEIDIHGGEDTRCHSYWQVCCKPDDQIPAEEVNVPPPQRQGCGWRNPNGLATGIKSVNDGSTNYAEFPWVTAILMEEPTESTGEQSEDTEVYLGGGSLIHPRVVLTAAHTVADRNRTLKVRAGEYDARTTLEIYPHQNRNVQKIVVHKDYSKKNLNYDVALLFLDSPMTLAANVAPVCLPGSGEEYPAGSRCSAFGWGKHRFNSKSVYSAVLKKVDLPVVEHAQCQNILRTTRLGRRFVLHPSFMCAGGDDAEDQCVGDGGAPLACPMKSEDNRFVQAGIVAWSLGCGQNGVPAVYVDVARVRGWIDEQLAGEGISINHE